MWVTSLQLADFRSYESCSVTLDPGGTLLLGPNGQGKTNLVEALTLVATHSSHRTSSDRVLIRHDQPTATIELDCVDNQERNINLRLGLQRQGSNQLRVNGSPVKFRDGLGYLRAVSFSPEDMKLVRGDPNDRRRFLDDVMVQLAPRYQGIRLDLDRTLRQRNALLKSLRGNEGGALDMLAPWDDSLVGIGVELFSGRLNALTRIAAKLPEEYRAISEQSQASARYVSDWWQPDRGDPAAQFRDALASVRKDEIRRGVTLVGPQRDDVGLYLDERSAKEFASQGEAWSLALALRLSGYQVLAELANGDPPVLILDDVFSELDEQRRQRLAASIATADQVLVTASVLADVPAELTKQTIDVRKNESGVSLATVPTTT